MTRSAGLFYPAPALRRPLTWLLSIGLLGQLLVPLQAHTAWRPDAGGRLVMICTLQGAEPHRTDPDEQPAGNTPRTPAVLLSLLLGDAAPGAAIALPPPRLIARAAPRARRADSVIEPSTRRPTIRAPPLS